MTNSTNSAKVFISCGQSDLSDERQIASQISERLRLLGFDPYVAVQEQTLRGVKENIFTQLSTSEYFLFIDFTRERLDSEANQEHRGSLFSHQELAIASYCDIPVLAFQEQRVKQHDGLLGFLQGNCIPFADRTMLAAVVEDAVRKHNWSPTWKNRLVIERDPDQFRDVSHVPSGENTRYFYIDVRNRHRDKAARNCVAYLDRIRDLATEKEIRPEIVEFKWYAYTFPNVVIAPGSARKFDAFYVSHENSHELQFRQFTDTNFIAPSVFGPGEFDFEYVVLSDNFPPATATLRLYLGRQIEEVTFKKMS